MPNVFATLFAADHAVSQSELSESVEFLRYRGAAGFTVAQAIRGDLPIGERHEIDGDLDDLTGPIVVLASECSYRPSIGQRVKLESGRVVRVRTVIDDPSGVTYSIMVEAEHG